MQGPSLVAYTNSQFSTIILTRNKGLLAQLLEPAFGHLNCFHLLLLLSNGVPLSIGVFNESRDILSVDCVHDIEEVISVRKAAFRQLVGEVLVEANCTLHLGPKRLHTDFIVVRHIDKPHILYRHELLLLSQDLFEEVFIEHGVVRQVELHYTLVRTE